MGGIGKSISADEWNDRRSKDANDSATSPSRKMRFRATESSDPMSIQINFRGVNGPDPPLSVVCHEIRHIAGRFDRLHYSGLCRCPSKGLAPVLPQCASTMKFVSGPVFGGETHRRFTGQQNTARAERYRWRTYASRFRGFEMNGSGHELRSLTAFGSFLSPIAELSKN
jgi:hypothetical protein